MSRNSHKPPSSSANGKQQGEPQGHPTLTDIARQIGVAPMTVSRVINESGYVSEAMRTKVLAAVEKFNYRPNLLARNLKRQRTQVIGILLADIANPFSAELVRGIQEVLLARNYSSFIGTTERSTQREQDELRALLEMRADGIIVATRETKKGNDYLLRLTENRLPLVVVGRTLNHPQVDHVTADHWRGGYEAVEHLIALGHRRIGFIGVQPVNGAGLRRYRGYLDALRDHELKIDEKLIVGPPGQAGPGYSTQDDGYDGMKRLLQLKARPSAVFARNDFTAMGAMHAIRDAGLNIPDDVAVVGFDNVSLAAYTAPPLTTVDQPTAEQGRRAATLLLERIEGNSTGGNIGERREVNLECHLVVRESTLGNTNKK